METSTPLNLFHFYKKADRNSPYVFSQSCRVPPFRAKLILTLRIPVRSRFLPKPEPDRAKTPGF